MYTYTKLYTGSEFNKDIKKISKISNTDINICSCIRYYKVQITIYTIPAYWN